MEMSQIERARGHIGAVLEQVGPDADQITTDHLQQAFDILTALFRAEYRNSKEKA